MTAKESPPQTLYGLDRVHLPSGQLISSAGKKIASFCLNQIILLLCFVDEYQNVAQSIEGTYNHITLGDYDSMCLQPTLIIH